MPVTLDGVARLALALPGAREGERRGTRTWAMNERVFAWERPFSKADLRRFGDETPPDGAIVAVRVADPGEKEAALATWPACVFTIPHFDGYDAVLVHLRQASTPIVRELLEDAWATCAPAAVVSKYKQDQRRRR
ncbi:MAG: MmcQ/YjbR family DNA-binding protein [Jatrophihabitans sp.]|uniref:MmcQ/YjbR family DNA-binding protein n=1 Tax=Jatrophihabitans sp. TaxID=1932789 RepID=UPI003F7E098B